MAQDSLPADCWSRTPLYRPGGKLSAEQLNRSQADAVMRDRLVNVAMHGVGVAHGYEVKTDERGKIVIENGCIHISCGLAFDHYGRMLFWRGGWISMRDVIGKKPDREGRYTLTVHYAERSDKGDPFDPCHAGADWIDRCVVFTLCWGCEDWPCCAPDVPSDDCMTRKEWICARSGFESGVAPADDQLEHACEQPPDLASSDCGTVTYDPQAGLPLLCIEICDLDKDKHGCDPRLDFCPCAEVESCSVRPVAYRSPLLYELISRDDVPLAKIASTSWADWEPKAWSDDARVPFDAFRRRAKTCVDDPNPDPGDGFSVRFTRPVKRSTVHPLSVLMEVYVTDGPANYWKPARVPIEIRHLDERGGLITNPEVDCVWGLMICPEKAWIQYELDTEATSTILDCDNKGYLARVEITLRGQIIRDCCGLMIDARPPDIDKTDTCKDRPGQSRAGDDYVSVFRVSKRAGAITLV